MFTIFRFEAFQHNFIELYLRYKVGPAGTMWHSGRSNQTFSDLVPQISLHPLQSFLQLLVSLKSDRTCQCQLDLSDRNFPRLVNIKFLKAPIDTFLQVVIDQISHIVLQLINNYILFV